jgi:hypothetical protein
VARGDYSLWGVNLHIETAAGSDPIPFSSREGKASVSKPTTQSLADNANGYCPLMDREAVATTRAASSARRVPEWIGAHVARSS